METGTTGMAIYVTLDAVIKDNRLRGNGDEGLFALESSSRNRITHNTFSGDTEWGVVVDEDDNDIASNRIDGGAIILGGDDNLLTKNSVTDPPLCDDGGGIGISFEHGTRDVIRRHVVRDARGDGIDVESPPATVRKNIAVQSGDRGVEAVAGVDGGGGNRAYANGNPLQCTIVRCSTGAGRMT